MKIKCDNIYYMLNPEPASSQAFKYKLAVSSGIVSRGQRQTNIPCCYLSHEHYEIFHSSFATYVQLIFSFPILLFSSP